MSGIDADRTAQKALGGILLAAVLVLVGVGCGTGKTAAPVLRPFAATGALESGMSGVGDGPSTPTGEHLRCWNGRRYAQNVTLRNTSKVPVTLTGAALGPASTPLVRRVAVQFRLAPPPPTGDQVVSGLRGWSRSAASPTKIPAGRSAWVQSNFELSHCGLLRSGDALIANPAITVTYRANSTDGSQRIVMSGARIVLTGNPAVHSPHSARSSSACRRRSPTCQPGDPLIGGISPGTRAVSPLVSSRRVRDEDLPVRPHGGCLERNI